MSIHRALPLNCSMFKFNCSDSFLEDLPKTGLMTILSSWPFFSVSRKPMLILSVALELNLLPLLDNTITGNVNFPSIHALILWLKHTLWTATSVLFLFVCFVCFLSYLQLYISNKTSKCGSLRSCGKGKGRSNTGAPFLLQCLHKSTQFLVRWQINL